MNKFLKIIFLVIAFNSHITNAQQVTKNDTISGTPYTMSMDKEVSEMMSTIEDKCSKINSDNSFKDSTNNTIVDIDAPKKTKTVASRTLTTAEICRQTPRMLGYRIQLAVVKSNEEANKVKAYFRSKFPTIKVQTDASLRPNYKILAGSYFSKQSASGDLAKIRQYFKSAIPVEYSIFCAESK